MTSPAERYAAARARARHGGVTEFESALPYALDHFQRQACQAVAEGRSVLVAAPTGAGKTVVGEFAVAHAHRAGLKAYYTTPIKALSNQKFKDLRRVYGDEQVGLLTGDNSINAHAPIVVMTTEVLRNMIYAGSEALDSLGVVILDEVHYLADRFRGSVWEEVIIHIGASTSIVALSATVSNAEEFGAWLSEVRGDTAVIVSEHRPVPLWPHVLNREGLFDLYAPGSTQPPRLNPELEALAKRQRQDDRHRPGRPRGGRRSPPRFAVVEVLDDHALLPAIVFIFSRAGCEDAVDQVRSAGVRLTDDDERARIARIVDERCQAVPTADLAALGYAAWRDHLEAGVAAHHAGMIPLFKEVVEELFAAGLLKVVYATETLALGINMPARSVVLEKLVKWDGRGHQDLTAGEYTQLTGRAGRRGIDIEGHAVVVEHPGFDAGQLGRLASRRTYPLISSFQPSYNMAINLVWRGTVSRARQLLEMSFAQYQADQTVVGKATAVRELEGTLQSYRDAAACDRGDFMEYAALRDKVSRAQKRQSQAVRQRRREASAATLAGLCRGDVVRIGAGRRAGMAVVVIPDADADAPRPTVVSDRGRAFRLAVADLHHGIEAVGTVRVPAKVNLKDAKRRKELGRLLTDGRVRFAPSSMERSTAGQDDQHSQVQRWQTEMRAHPCHSCPDRETHARWAERHARAMRDRDRLMGQISRATGSIARQFDRRCAVLRTLGYLQGDGDDTQVTDTGAMLRTVYSEADLVIAECLRAGTWESLHPPALAATVSALLYSGRREDEARTPRIPGGTHGVLGRALQETTRVWSHISDLHAEHRLPEIAEPHWGMVATVHGWAQGKSLDVVLSGTDIAPGDMVRWCKQVIDVLEQIAGSSPSESVRERALAAVTMMRRGVVAY